jgi:PAS domain S-box-containing protein/putative nucleotidyltransferase with HDIG domain
VLSATTVLAVVCPVLTVARGVPQGARLRRSGGTGVSQGTWLLVVVVAELWLAYGLVFRVPAEVAANVPNALLAGMIVLLVARSRATIGPSVAQLVLLSATATGIALASLAVHVGWALSAPAVLGSLGLYLPQLVKVLREDNLAGVSLTTWSIAFATALAWGIYGLLIHQAPIWIPSVVTVPSSFLIVARVARRSRAGPPFGDRTPSGLRLLPGQFGPRAAEYQTMEVGRDTSETSLARAQSSELLARARVDVPRLQLPLDLGDSPLTGVPAGTGTSGPLTRHRAPEDCFFDGGFFDGSGSGQQSFDAFPDGVVLVGLDGRILAANGTQARMYGYGSPDDLVGTHATLLVAPSCRDYAAEILRRRIAGEDTLPVEYELLRRDGTTFYGETSATILRGPDGGVEGYVCTTRDTTERRRAQEALRESAERYHDLFDGAIEGIYQITLEGRILTSNRALAEMLGYGSPEEVVAEVVDTAQQIWADPDERAVFTTRVREQGLVRGHECQFVRKDGQRIWVSISGRLVHSADGKPFYEGFVEDITQRKRAEESSRRSELLFRAFVEQAPVAIDVTRDGTCLYANQKLAEMLGLANADSVVGLPVHLFSAPHMQARSRALTLRRSLGLPVPVEYETVFQRADGSQFPVQIAVGPVRLADGGAHIGFITDITDRRAAADALSASKAMRDVTERVAKVGSWRVDLQPLRSSWSTGMFELFDVGFDELQADPGPILERRVHPDDLEAVLQTRATMRATGDPPTFEFRLVRSDGTVRVLYGEAAAERDSSGAIVAVTGYFQDVTERREAEREAKERSHFLEQLLKAIPLPVYYKDTTFHFVGHNSAYTASIGLPGGEVIGKTVFDVRPGDLAERFDASDRELLARQGPPIEEELEMPAPDGTVRHVQTHKAMISDVAGKPAGIVGVNLDVTEIRQAQKQIAAAAVRLEHTLQGAVSALSATTELRDPYTAGHQRRVAELACAIARELGFDGGRIELLRTAAVLHDIGKILVPAEILAKPGRLSQIEMQIIRQHSAAGADIVAPIGFDPDVAEMIRQHHERLDGSGYPAGLVGDKILPEAMVLAVADVVEAMISHRPYRAALAIEAAVAELYDGATVRYEAAACRAAISLLREQGFSFSQ